MTIIEKLITRARKVAGTDAKARRFEALMEQAYEAGRQAAIRDITITLEDDMINDDHTAAIEVITANF
jgi:hypothetical protein